jgi:hypothetical protein
MKTKPNTYRPYLLIPMPAILRALLALGSALAVAAPASAADPFTATGAMQGKRANFTATLLPDGKVLAAGGAAMSGTTSGLSSAELYNPSTGTWAPTAAMGTERSDHTATLLPNGKVLVAGGGNSSTAYLSSAELYNPATGTWAPTGAMSNGRLRPTATLLADGRVLIVGGLGLNSPSGRLSSAELYNPATGTWAPTGSMSTVRWNHTATLLPNGKVLVAGGSPSNTSYLPREQRSGDADLSRRFERDGRCAGDLDRTTGGDRANQRKHGGFRDGDCAGKQSAGDHGGEHRHGALEPHAADRRGRPRQGICRQPARLEAPSARREHLIYGHVLSQGWGSAERSAAPQEQRSGVAFV